MEKVGKIFSSLSNYCQNPPSAGCIGLTAERNLFQESMEMNKKSLALLFAVLACSWGCGEQQKTPASPGPQPEASSTSPEDTLEAAKAAIRDEDYAAFCDCWTPQGQDFMATGFVFILGFLKEAVVSKGDSEAADGITQVLGKHGLSEGGGETIHLTDDKEANQKEMLKLIKPIKNRTAFIVDVLTLMPTIADHPEAKLLEEDAHLVDLTITDDMAMATLVQTRGEESKESPISFEKLNGQWKISTIERLLQ